MRPVSWVSAASLAAFVVGFSSTAEAQSIDPSSFTGTMSVGQTITISKTITLGASGANRVDLFFLADNTGSMGGIINNAKSGASGILGAVPPGADYNFGVGEYNSDPCEAIDAGGGVSACSGYPTSWATTPYYAENTALTSSTAAAQAGINLWSASGGGDYPEANFYALQQLANTAAWRTGSQRLIVWFGDAPSHTATTTQAEAITALQAAGATVIAFNSTASTGGINTGGEANAITTATGGSLTNSFGSVTGQAFIDAVNAEISLATSTLDLAFGSDLVGSGLTLSFVCTDVLGCDGVGGGESRTFDLMITANTVGVYDFSVFASGVDAKEFDHITVSDSVVPEPSTWLLLGTGLLGLGIVARKRKEDEEAA